MSQILMEAPVTATRRTVVEFRVLGSLEVVGTEGLIELRGAKIRALLAVLLMHPNRVVSSDRLIEALWGDRPPSTAAGTLHTYVCKLRSALGPDRIETRSPGYVLAVDPGSVDAGRFERLAAEGTASRRAGDLVRASLLLQEALALWRGKALADFLFDEFAQADVARLEESRLATVEEWLEAELVLGHHTEIAGRLRALVDEHPLRERLWGQLILALYRCGRQGDALRAYGELRRRLGDELGIEPSVALRRLEEAVLLQKPELEWSPLEPPVDGTRAGAVRPQTRNDLPFPSHAVRSDGPFVGRQGELERLEAEFERAGEDGPRLALLCGDAGVGKTRLAVEMALTAHGQGACVLFGRCNEELVVPYEPFAEALAQLVRHLPHDELTGLAGGSSVELARLTPDLGDWAPRDPAPADSDPEMARHRMFEAVARTLAAVSRRTPVVLVLDDLQWATPPTLALLRHILTSADAMRVLVIGTYRSTERPERDSVRGFLPDLERRRDVTTIELTGIDEGAVGELLRIASGRGLGPEGLLLARSIRGDTGGNAFLVGEVVRHLVQSGMLLEHNGQYRSSWRSDRSTLPHAVFGVVRARLERLSETTARLLRLGAVIGNEYDMAVLQGAAGLDEDTVLSALEEAIQAGFVTEVPGLRLRQQFAHSIVRAVLYEDLTLARRAQLHRRVGEAIEAAFPSRVDEHLSELAHHFARAAEIGGAGKALRYSQEAGDRALEQLAPDEAVTFYAQALTLLETSADPPDACRRCDLLLALGEAQRRSGAAGHRETLLEAAGMALRLRDSRRLAAAALANSRGFWSATRRVDAERVAMLRHALQLVGEEDSSVRAQLLATLAVELVYGANFDETKLLSDEALAMARRVGDPKTLARVLTPRYNTIRSDPGTLAERLANTAELVAVAQLLHDPAVRCMAPGWRALAAMEAGDTDEADRCFRIGERLAAELRQPTILWYQTYCRASRMQVAGRFDEADRLAVEARQLGKSAGHPDSEMFFWCQQLQAAFERGSLARHERTLRLALAKRPESWWFVRSWQALLYCELDRDDEAREAFDELAANDFADFAFEPTWLYILANCAMVCAHLGDERRAALLSDLLTPYADQVVTMCSLAYSGSVCHYLGLLAATRRRLEEADGYFARAAAVHERIGAPAWLARTRVAWAGTILGSGGSGPARHAEAHRLLEPAIALAADFGLGTVERRGRALRDAALAE